LEDEKGTTDSEELQFEKEETAVRRVFQSKKTVMAHARHVLHMSKKREK